MKLSAGPKGKHAWTVKVGEKGQFVIPKEARELFDIVPGDTLILFADEETGLAIPDKKTLARLMSTAFKNDSFEGEDEE